MKLNNPGAAFYIPDGADEATALSRTTHLCIAAHQDDTEIMAYHGVAECFGQPDKWFSNVTVTDGAGSPRSGIYARYTDEEMRAIRKVEQRKAAMIGEYSFQIQLNYSSSAVKDPKSTGVCQDLLSILQAARPQVVYLHNLADKHDTHVATSLRAIAALRSLEPSLRPSRVYGCEVWRGLDWLPDSDKQALPVSRYPNLAAALLGIFDSQVSGGKRYDLATAGRRLANATYLASHETDQEQALTFAMDLTPLIEDPSKPISAYVTGFLDRIKQDIEERIQKFA